MFGSTAVQIVMLGTEQVWALAPPYLSVTPVSQSLPKTSGSFTIQINSNTDWEIENTNSWLTISSTSGNGNATITVTYTANSALDRSGNIIVRSAIVLKIIAVTQLRGIEPYLSVYPYEFALGASDTSSQYINVRCNTMWWVDKEEVYPGTFDWIELQGESGDGGIRFSLTSNTYSDQRYCAVTVYYGDGTTSEQVVIIQNGYRA